MNNEKPVLLIFLDGLKPENVGKLEILERLPHQGRVRGKYGYSIACHGSMYTGEDVEKHKNWFVWQRSEGRGYMKNPLWKAPIFNNVIFRLCWHKFLIRKAKRLNTSFFGIPRVVHCNTVDLFDFHVTETRNYDEYGYMSHAKGFLDSIRDSNLELDLVGFSKEFKEESEILSRWKPKRKVDVTYWFLGDVDHFSHEFGQDSDDADKRFRHLNEVLNGAYARFVEFYGEEPIVFAWSDHGHAMITDFIDLYDENVLKDLLKTTCHVVDATAVRFWKTWESDSQWQEKVSIIDDVLFSKSDKFEESEMRREKLWPGDNRYGDLVYMLHKGFCFKRTIWGFSSKVVSQHGYNPLDPELDGFAASNQVSALDGACSDINLVATWVKEICRL